MNACSLGTIALLLTSVVAGADSPIFAELAPEAAAFRAELDHADGVYRDGEFLRVRFQANQPLHVYVLYHQADGNAVMVFPNAGRPDSRLNQAGLQELPARDDVVQCVIRGPFTEEAVQIVASAEPIAALEAALTDSPEAVPVITSSQIDAVCAAHAASEGLAAQVLTVSSPAKE
ncbi:DUF4384 domain-containing protein [Botrimarina hoheduenensis]|uniref:DUF4384 domain-containing protein n=1 Tax=Botrimarina hoheduenensis TaxID=2528000 RepID=A0A5C5WDT3_9BACT|nr:DUF4384 domain-containing protein [Botrimarina hoheduenensis]TWT47852.1 hypothetical protein Pla111_14780 [Botrimarina hoheduenensis]